jgi:hypothetical protein
LELIHQVASEEYSNISERWTPVEFEWMHNAFRIRYAEQRKEGPKNSPGVREEIIGHFDRRISERLGRIAAVGTGIAVIGFALAVLSALI